MFCGSREGTRLAYAEAARSMGKEIARRGLGLVYGGGRVGLMGAVADAALEESGEVIGVITEALISKEIAQASLAKLQWSVPCTSARC